MDSIISIVALIVSTLSAIISTVWVLAKNGSLKREDIDSILLGVTDRIEKLVDRIDKLTENSVKRDEFQKELLMLREKVTKHIGNIDIHVGHSE